ncbi:MAG: Dabb family protein [Roseburia sp.]|nr:Dabb family protein [Roseburia sp.]MCM1242627.1 Dabb family protein [Roseburia sp.]
MIQHIVLWNFKEDLTAEEKNAAAARMKKELEAIKELVPGTVSIQVVKNEMDSSNCDVALISTFESKEALDKYQSHPEHLKAKDFIVGVVDRRVCLDYEK